MHLLQGRFYKTQQLFNTHPIYKIKNEKNKKIKKEIYKKKKVRGIQIKLIILILKRKFNFW
jgi:hypothetical protein